MDKWCVCGAGVGSTGKSPEDRGPWGRSRRSCDKVWRDSDRRFGTRAARRSARQRTVILSHVCMQGSTRRCVASAAHLGLRCAHVNCVVFSVCVHRRCSGWCVPFGRALHTFYRRTEHQPHATHIHILWAARAHSRLTRSAQTSPPWGRVTQGQERHGAITGSRRPSNTPTSPPLSPTAAATVVTTYASLLRSGPLVDGYQYSPH